MLIKLDCTKHYCYVPLVTYGFVSYNERNSSRAGATAAGPFYLTIFKLRVFLEYMKYAAILGFLGLVSIATVTLTQKPQPIEPVVSGSQNEGSISVPENSETKTETPTTQPSNPSPKSQLIKLADLIIPRTEEEQDAAIDQNTLKNVEQDAKLEEHENAINDLQTEIKCQDQTATNYLGTIPCLYPPPPPPPAPEPTPPPAPDPVYNFILKDSFATSNGWSGNGFTVADGVLLGDKITSGFKSKSGNNSLDGEMKLDVKILASDNPSCSSDPAGCYVNVLAWKNARSIGISFLNNGKVRFYDNASFTNFSTFEFDTWYTIAIEWKANGTARYSFNGQWTDWKPITNPPAGFNTVYLNMSGNMSAYFDNLE